MTGLIHTLIEEASTLGVKELACYYLGFSVIYHYFPDGVFKITTLTKLSVHAICDINGGRVQCSCLVSLSLHRVRIHGDVIKEILRACPLIETLDLSHLGPRKTYLGNNVDDMLTDDDIVLCPHLASLTLHDVRMSDFSVIGDILSGSPMIEKLDFDGGKASDSVLPAHVFALESITCLSVRHCEIQIDDGRILCSNLRSLDFCSIQIGDDSIRYIFLACPLVENLKMDECYGMSNINVSNLHNLVSLRVASCYSVTYRPAEVSFGSGSISVPEFHRLCYVVLKKVRVHKDFFTELSSKFPRIEDLLLDKCSGYKHILQISSPSLKYFKLYHRKGLQKAEFDVPSIRKFVFHTTYGDYIPSLSFRTAPREWDSKVTFPCSLKCIRNSWFVRLRDFLQELRLSRTSFRFQLGGRTLAYVNDFPCAPTPVVEKLTINKACVSHAFLCALFRSCRPTFITLRLGLDCLDSYTYCFAKLLYELFMINQKISKNVSSFNKIQGLLIYDMEEIDVLLCHRTVPLEKFVEDGPVFCSRPVRFRFKWGALDAPR